MNATIFKQRLTLAKQRLREMKATGQPVELTRSWSYSSLKGLSKALEGGPPGETGEGDRPGRDQYTPTLTALVDSL